ncbi:DNA helicase [Fusarium sporotrichioides]|uniref:DNA helicase n=1 Tax=Fusarium sporotrichioides TaxID=5514 RepID=A0A395SIL2_FUSSP|nr:DNA helicase [Fusarium sporotrichioides]
MADSKADPKAEAEGKAKAEPTGAPGPSQMTGKRGMRSYVKDCAILIGDCGPVFASGKSLGSSKLDAQLGVFKHADEESWFGLQIKIPLGKNQAANEASGFGVLHAHDSKYDDILASDQYIIQVRFPRDSVKQTVGPAPDKVVSMFPNAKTLSYTKISFGNSKPTVFGYGRPYANAEDPELQGWVKDNKPILKQYTLLDALQLVEYHIVVPIKAADVEKNLDTSRLHPVFAFPYAVPEAWAPSAFKQDIAANPGHKYKPDYMLPDNNSLITAMTQSVVQDMMWLDDAVKATSTIKVPGYFIPEVSEGTRSYYVVVALPPEFIPGFDAAWRRLTKNADAFNLLIWGSKNKLAPQADWDCRLMSHPETLDQLSDHPIKDHEIVLLVCRPEPCEKRNDMGRSNMYHVKTYPNREEANKAFEQSEDH